MLCPPQPWSTPHNGGYLLNKSDLIRLPHQVCLNFSNTTKDFFHLHFLFQAIQQWERINSIHPQNIYPALDSLNQLANIPWRVNTDVRIYTLLCLFLQSNIQFTICYFIPKILDVIIHVFQNGGDNKLDVPQPPSSLPPLPSLPAKDSSVSNEDRAKLFKDKMAYRRKQAEMYSLWCDTLYRLSLADHVSQTH